MGDDWEQRIAAVWETAADNDESAVLAAVLTLADERPDDDPVALFERASAYDYVGREPEAEPLYRNALAGGLTGERRPQAVIQLASTLRNLGRAADAVELLEGTPDDDGAGLADARAAFHALALLDAGRPDEAVARLLLALAGHLRDYRRAVTYYATELLER